MTYDALENRLRKVKKEATKMKEEAEGQPLAGPADGKSKSKKADAGGKKADVGGKKVPGTPIKDSKFTDRDLCVGWGD